MADVDFTEYVDVIKDWPEPGKAVCDISKLLEHPHVFHEAVVALAKPLVEVRPNKVIGIEQRGLAMGSAIALYATAKPKFCRMSTLACRAMESAVGTAFRL